MRKYADCLSACSQFDSKQCQKVFNCSHYLHYSGETEKSDAAFFSNQLVTLLIFSAEFNIAEIVRVVIKVSTEMQGVYAIAHFESLMIMLRNRKQRMKC